MPGTAASVLVLDTATPTVTAAVVRVAEHAVEPVSVQAAGGGRRHGELLGPLLAAAVADAGLTLRDLTAVVVGTGPGPFTGLRVGLVTAAALTDVLSIPAYGVCSLDGLAGAPAAGPVLCATDARRRELYWAVYVAGARVAGPAVDLPADVADRAAELGATVARGAGARLYDLGVPVQGPDAPDPVALAAVAAPRVRAGAPADPLTPLYLRRPDAVEPGRPKAVSRS